ncbi:MAG: hypothetical protein K8Q89_06275 [Nitrosarchaeum sp.]|nr:hypothetical protein [Nitrosarchaeum sp.]
MKSNKVEKLANLPISDSATLSAFVHLLDFAIKIGKYFPLISICLTCLNLTLAVNDFLANNLGFAILNSMFVVSGLVFIIQMHLVDRIHHISKS